MTYGAFTQDFAPYSYGRQARRLDSKIGFCIIALGVTTSIGIWALCPHALPSMPQIASLSPVPAAPTVQKIAALVAKPAETQHRAPDAAARGMTPYGMAIALRQAAAREAGLLDPALTSSYAAVVFARNAPLRMLPAETAPATRDPVQVAVAVPQVVPEQPVVPDETIVPEQKIVSPLVASESAQDTPEASAPTVADVPLPQRRPANLGAIKPTARVASADRDVAPPSAAPSAAGEVSQPTFFDKLFGRPKDSGAVLAYAAPEDGMIGNVLKNTMTSPQAVDRYTAVYNITTHTVTLPDGTRLEAHSGLGAARDNPRSVAQRMVGATPPNVYDLTPREALFHGVRALRMNPTGGTTFGRAGLLTHTYMLRGHSGESNGCVVFRDYEAFLRAYDSGAIRRLAVVAGG